MASLFGDDDINDLFNDNLRGQELPSGDEDENKNVFGDGDNEANGEAAEGEAVKVEPKKRSVRRPRHRLTVETLRGPRGIHTIEEYFKDIKFKGKGHERDDLDEVMHRLQHWGHRMFASYKFDDVLANIERLGKKKPLQVHMSRYRLGMLENIALENLNDDEEGAANEEAMDEPYDEFDALLGEQIAISKLAPRTPAQHSRHAAETPMTSSTLATPSFDRGNAVMSTPYTRVHHLDESDLAQPLPPSQPETPIPVRKQLTAEQMARIAENRRLAQERLKAKRMQQAHQPEAIPEEQD